MRDETKWQFLSDEVGSCLQLTKGIESRNNRHEGLGDSQRGFKRSEDGVRCRTFPTYIQ